MKDMNTQTDTTATTPDEAWKEFYGDASAEDVAAETAAITTDSQPFRIYIRWADRRLTYVTGESRAEVQEAFITAIDGAAWHYATCDGRGHPVYSTDANADRSTT